MNQLSPLLHHIFQSPSVDSDGRRLVSEIFHAISAIIPRVNDLMSADSLSMPEAIVIQAVYVAIGPFFVVEGGNDVKGKDKKGNAVLSTLGSSAMRGLRLDALGLIRSVGHVATDLDASLILHRFSPTMRINVAGSSRKFSRLSSSCPIPNRRLDNSSK